MNKANEGTFDLSTMSEEFQRGYRAAELHYPPRGTWRGSCGHLWDRAVEDTDECPRCHGDQVIADLIDAAEALHEGERFDEELFWERYAALRAALAALEPQP